MKKYLIILLLTSCVKPPIIPPPEPPPIICTDEISLALSIHLTDQEPTSHIEISVGTNKSRYVGGTIINAVEAYEHTYNDTVILDQRNIEAADTIFVDYKIFSRSDGSFYFAKRDTLLK